MCLYVKFKTLLNIIIKTFVYVFQAPTPVLLCHWSRSGVLDCYEHDGYKYREHKGNTVTLNVLHASLEDTGKYACVLMSHSTPGTYKKCNLTVQGNLTENIIHKCRKKYLPASIKSTVKCACEVLQSLIWI